MEKAVVSLRKKVLWSSQMDLGSIALNLVLWIAKATKESLPSDNYSQTRQSFRRISQGGFTHLTSLNNEMLNELPQRLFIWHFNGFFATVFHFRLSFKSYPHWAGSLCEDLSCGKILICKTPRIHRLWHYLTRTIWWIFQRSLSDMSDLLRGKASCHFGRCTTHLSNRWGSQQLFSEWLSLVT
jgi:hypothetical protein